MASARLRSSTSKRTPAATLTRDDIIEAARRVVLASGTDGLTMRRLAEELGTTPMAAYHHVKSKEELLEALGALVVQEAFAEVQAGDGTSWEQRLRASAHATFDALTAYPGLARFLLDRPVAQEFRHEPNGIVGLLEDAGLNERDARLAQATYHTYVFGLLGIEVRFRPLKRAPKDGSHDAILVDVDVDQFIDYGVDLLIDGIRARAARTS